jgi:DNA-binding CsgD family transcriptional regulator
LDNFGGDSLGELTQTEWETINEIIAQINNAKNITIMRKKFLKELGRLIEYDIADFCLSNYKEAKGVNLVDPVVVSRYSKDFERRFTQEYEKKYEQYDYTNWIYSNLESMVFIESDIINNEARMKSAYYQNFLKPLNLTNVLGLSLAANGIPLGAVSIYRIKEKGDFTPKDSYIVKQFITHLNYKMLSEKQVITPIQDKYEGTLHVLKQDYALSKREIEVVKLVCKGLNNEQIGEALVITTNTVKKHMNNIFGKLHVTNRVQVIHLLLEEHKEFLLEEEK